MSFTSLPWEVQTSRPLHARAANTACQLLKSLVAIAAIAMGSPLTVNAESSLFGFSDNLSADLFAPAVKLTSGVDVDDSHQAAIESVLEIEDGSEPMTTGLEELRLLSPIPPLSQFQPGQMSLQARRDTRIEGSGLRKPARSRPPVLVPLYVTFTALQILDAHSTTRGLKNGAVEANPVMAPSAGNTATLLVTKAAAAGAVLYLTEKIWRKNRFAAILTMVAVNSGLAVVVQRNYGIASR
jgi:hypothetical protein